MPRKSISAAVVPIEDLALDPRNARVHGEKNSAAIESSLNRFGPARSVVVDGGGVVRAGNGTLDAARKAGVKEVLVIDPRPGQLVAVRRKDWTPTEATAYALADNRTAELAEWDDAALGEILRGLQAGDVPTDGLGWDASEVTALVGEWSERDPRAAGADPQPVLERRAVVVECRDEAQQRELYDRLTADGLECRLIVV